jgi:hypothetical protein
VDTASILPVAGQFAKAGLPILAKVVGLVLPPPFGSIASLILGEVADALGTDPTPEAVIAAVEKDPVAAQEKLKAVEEKYASLLDFAKLQTDINAKEAESSSLFIAGWRPALGWSLVAMVTWQWTASIWSGPYVEVSIFNAMLVLLGGVAGLRSTEKWAGVATESIKAAPRILARRKG